MPVLTATSVEFVKRATPDFNMDQYRLSLTDGSETFTANYWAFPNERKWPVGEARQGTLEVMQKGRQAGEYKFVADKGERGKAANGAAPAPPQDFPPPDTRDLPPAPQAAVHAPLEASVSANPQAGTFDREKSIIAQSSMKAAAEIVAAQIGGAPEVDPQGISERVWAIADLLAAGVHERARA